MSISAEPPEDEELDEVCVVIVDSVVVVVAGVELVAICILVVNSSTASFPARGEFVVTLRVSLFALVVIELLVVPIGWLIALGCIGCSALPPAGIELLPL